MADWERGPCDMPRCDTEHLWYPGDKTSTWIETDSYRARSQTRRVYCNRHHLWGVRMRFRDWVSVAWCLVSHRSAWFKTGDLPIAGGGLWYGWRCRKCGRRWQVREPYSEEVQ